MNRREFLKKGLEGIIIGSIPLISCSKNPVGSYKGSISGKVMGTDQTVKVRAIQNLSLVSETTTNSDGNYKIEDLPEGKYGLLFAKEDVVYIYNDQINSSWYTEEGNIEVNETIVVNSGKNSGDYNIDLGPIPSWGTGEHPDYGADEVFVLFNDEVPQNKIEALITDYNCSINHKYESGSYLSDIPDNKTVLEMIRAFKSESIVKFSHPNRIMYALPK